ncbi:hypothetical protein BC829DRAFT_439759 [Chytridium lagenaria]|nr:hypothetical protein BC829DRAFT_439759 [Chytridium lagenaria]
MPLTLSEATLNITQRDQFSRLLERQKLEVQKLHTAFSTAWCPENGASDASRIPGYVLGRMLHDDDIYRFVFERVGEKLLKDRLGMERSRFSKLLARYQKDRHYTWEMFCQENVKAQNQPFPALSRAKEIAYSRTRKSNETAYTLPGLRGEPSSFTSLDAQLIRKAELQHRRVDFVPGRGLVISDERESLVSLEEVEALFEKSYDRLRLRHSTELCKMNIRHLHESMRLIDVLNKDRTWLHVAWQGDLENHSSLDVGGTLMVTVKLYCKVPMDLTKTLSYPLKRKISADVFNEKELPKPSLSCVVMSANPFDTERALQTVKFLEEYNKIMEFEPRQGSGFVIQLFPMSRLQYIGEMTSNIEALLKIPEDSMVMIISGPRNPAGFISAIEAATCKTSNDYMDRYLGLDLWALKKKPVVVLKPALNVGTSEAAMDVDVPSPTTTATSSTTAVNVREHGVRRDPRQR